MMMMLSELILTMTMLLSLSLPSVQSVSTEDSSPVLTGSLTGVITETDGEGDVILTIQAEDRDNVPPRSILYELKSNPHNYFRLHPSSGELSLARQPDREALAGAEPSNILTVEVVATELSDGQRDGNTSSTALVNIIVRDQADLFPRTGRITEEPGCLCGQKRNMIQVKIFAKIQNKLKPPGDHYRRRLC